MNRKITRLKLVAWLTVFTFTITNLIAFNKNPYKYAKKDLTTIANYLRKPDHGGIEAQAFRIALARVGLSLAAVTAITVGGALAGYKMLHTVTPKPLIIKRPYTEPHLAQSDDEKDFFKAIYGNDNNTVQQLINKGVSVNLKDECGDTPLMIAALQNQKTKVKMLLNAGAEVNVQDNLGQTALHRILEENKKDIVELLIEYGADINISGPDFMGRETPLMKAARNGSINLVKILLKAGARVNDRDISDDTALIYALQEGKNDIVKLLIKNRADLNIDEKNFRGKKPLILAAEKGNINAVRMLLDAGANINARDMYGYSALGRAIESNKIDIIQFLIKRGADVELEGSFLNEKPLILAAEKGNINAVKILLDAEAKVDAQSNGKTALRMAIKNGRDEIVKLLLERGAAVMSDKFGITDLHAAVSKENEELVKLFLEKRPTISIQDKSNALRAAIVEGSNTIADLLLEHGADINEPDKNGQTALFDAARRGELNAVINCLEKGANPNILDNNNKAPLDYATDNEISIILINAMTQGRKK